MLDIPPSTLRTWEERYRLVVPLRSAGGQRLYTRAQVEQLRFVSEQLQAGVQPADAHRLLDEQLRNSGALGIVESGLDAPRMLILLAERDSFTASLTEFFLKTEGFDVEAAFGVDDAEARFDELEPSLCVIELLLSGGRGLDLCRRFKEGRDAPVLAISGLADRDRAFAAGADAFLQKPLDPLDLVSTVKDLLGLSALVARAGARV
jgi:CheY-like chemotaxis protein